VLQQKFPDLIINVEEFLQKNWNELWEKSIEPVYIRNKIVIFPSWKKNQINNDFPVRIEIDPKMSFGTGHNETTQLVLEMLCDFLTKDDNTMLDYGSGTGILSIAGIKLGLKSVTAIDIDENAVENSKEYFFLNNVDKYINLLQCNIYQVSGSGFDIISANIISSVIKDNIVHIFSKLKPKGKFFLSGILINETEEILKLLTDTGFKPEHLSQKSEWLGIHCIKP